MRGKITFENCFATYKKLDRFVVDLSAEENFDLKHSLITKYVGFNFKDVVIKTFF